MTIYLYFVTSGSAFQYEDYFRIVLTVPEKEVEEAMRRIEQFCNDVRNAEAVIGSC